MVNADLTKKQNVDGVDEVETLVIGAGPVRTTRPWVVGVTNAARYRPVWELLSGYTSWDAIS